MSLMPIVPKRTGSNLFRTCMLCLLILCKLSSTAFSQSTRPDTIRLQLRPVRLTERQVKQAIADRISVPNLQYQNTQLRLALETETQLAATLSDDNQTLRTQADQDTDTIKKQSRKIFWLKVERWVATALAVYLAVTHVK